jgi:hypothetical protein
VIKKNWLVSVWKDIGSIKDMRRIMKKNMKLLTVVWEKSREQI